jgi:transposase
MGNNLKMEKRESVLALLKLGWSYRQVERETGVRRETIGKYDRERESKAATVPTGTEEQNRPECPPGTSSFCESFREQIESKIRQGLDARRIHQDLVFEHGFRGGYDSVKRFSRSLRQSDPEVFARVEVAPGYQMGIDFFKGAPTLDNERGKHRKPHVFEAVLSYSRHSYQEAVWRQDVETFVGCVENAFIYFGGVVETVILDNLKSGITQACLYDPDVNTVFAALARHYGFAVLPIRPRTPRHNGKTERHHGYTESSALRGRRFESLEEQNRHLAWWNQNIARLRIHGTTKQQVWARFELEERHALRPLPATRFSFFHTGTRSVYTDGHVEVGRAFYSVPTQYLGYELRVDWDDRIVRIYDNKNELIVLHPRTSPGRFETKPEHLPEKKRYAHIKTESRLLVQASGIGPQARAWAEEALQVRGILAYRLLHGLISLTRKHPASTVNRACQTALQHHAFRYRTLATLCKRQVPEQRDLFIADHELIRPLSEYQALLEKGLSDDLL